MGKYLLSTLAHEVKGTVIGSDVSISQVASLKNAQPDQITFLMNDKYELLLAESLAGAVILSHQFANMTDKPRLVVDNPYSAFAKIARLLNPPKAPKAGIHPQAVIARSAQIDQSAEIGAWVSIGERVIIGPRVIIHPGCAIGDEVEIKEDSILYPHVTVYPRCLIGKRVVLQAGAVIGSEGFGNLKEEGRWVSIPQIGRVILEDDVQVGANTTIDCGTLDDTIIREGTRLDNQIQIAHNVEVGPHTAIAGCVGIAGSTKIGAHCIIGGAVSISGHLTITDHVTLLAATTVIGSISKAGVYGGPYPIQPQKEWVQTAAQLRRLKNLYDRLRQLEQDRRTEKS